jgi:hypothetical protein
VCGAFLPYQVRLCSSSRFKVSSILYSAQRKRVGILVLLELKWIVCEFSLMTAADLSLIISLTNKVPTKIGLWFIVNCIICKSTSFGHPLI